MVAAAVLGGEWGDRAGNGKIRPLGGRFGWRRLDSIFWDRICVEGGVDPWEERSGGSAWTVTGANSADRGKKKAMDGFPGFKGTRVFIYRMNCPMKSNLGKVLADELKYYYFDSDSLVEQATAGDPAAKSFQERDDETFRESESEVLKQLSAMGRLVVCVGDGALQSSTNLAFLRDGISLWIDVPLDYLAKNICIADGSELDFETPHVDDLLLKGAEYQVMDYLSARYNELKGGYETADATVSLLKVASQLGYEDFSSVSSEDMAVQAFKEIERLTRLKKMIEAAAKPF
ncbi:hypothetical protein KSP39_PZI023469 [Platanthera zijinensis]|uniref:Inactive shikimate kinase like 1, chloroplastic n=1 Tax=Platanthera zijinensis TaxID=2320716 RepID=A0AAP0AUC5_9ASPA